WFAARVAVGHTTFFPFALLPFVFLFYLHSAAPGQLAGRVRWAVAAAFVLAVMFLSGGIYPFYAAALLLVFHSVLDFFGARSLRPVILVLAILALAVILSSVKLLPVLDFAGGAVPEKDVQLTTGSILFSSLLSRQQSIVPNDMETGRDLVAEGRQKELDTLAGNLPWGWHEYSAYIGVIPAILVALAAALGFRRNWKLAVSALFFFLLAIGSYFPVGPWQLVREIPFFSSLHGPSRFMIVFVLFAALLAARALSSLRVPGGSRVNAAVTAAILLVVVADLFLVSRPLLLDAFPLQPLEVRSTNIGSPEIIQMYSSAPSLSQYPNLLQGIGTVNCYERLHLRIRAVPQFVDGEPYNGFIGNAYIAETNETLNFTLFTPQKVSLRLSGIPMAESALSSGNVSELTLVINQNYYKGWALAGSLGEAGSHRGLLATLVKEKDLGKALTFSYSSRPFALGGVISLIGLIAALAAFWRPGRLRFLGPFGKKLESHVFRQS
ncbi:TPA: hypothetical protein HA231_00035, partial [Candidatus Woesearchaeota archaeon]|nr:hypothetical protein [Candidatus Woesearchaeota archaeon]